MIISKYLKAQSCGTRDFVVFKNDKIPEIWKVSRNKKKQQNPLNMAFI